MEAIKTRKFGEGKPKKCVEFRYEEEEVSIVLTDGNGVKTHYNPNEANEAMKEYLALSEDGGKPVLTIRTSTTEIDTVTVFRNGNVTPKVILEKPLKRLVPAEGT